MTGFPSTIGFFVPRRVHFCSKEVIYRCQFAEMDHYLRSSPHSGEYRVFSEIRCPSVRSYGDSKYYRPCLEFFVYGNTARIFISALTVKCSHHRGYEPEGTAPSVLRSYHVHSPMTFVCSGARHTCDFSFLPKRHQITPYFVGVDLSTMRHSESDHSHLLVK